MNENEKEKEKEYVLNEIKYIFDNVNKLLMFIETKNALLLPLNAVVLWTIITDNSNIEKVEKSQCLEYIGNIGIVLMVISTLICLLSFYPRLYKASNWVFLDKKRNNSNNHLYFKDIYYNYRDDYKEYLEHISKLYGSKGIINKQPYLDYAEEIITNSKITYIKSINFAISFIFLIGSMICMFVYKFM